MNPGPNTSSTSSRRVEPVFGDAGTLTDLSKRRVPQGPRRGGVVPRKPWLALLLDLLLPPLGHVYVGAPLAGLLWVLLILGVPLLIALMRWNFTSSGLLVMVSLPVLLWLLMAVRASRLAAGPRSYRPRWYNHWAAQLALALLIGAGIYQLVVGIPDFARNTLGFVLVRVDDASMQPALQSGDRVMVDTRAYLTQEPARGELVAVEAEDGSRSVLRVVGRPGERVRVRIDSLVIDSQAAEDPHGRWDLEVPAGTAFSGDGEWQLGREQFVLLGDHRLLARDSRALGAVPLTRILGRVQVLVHGPSGTWLPLSASEPEPILRWSGQP